VGEVRDGAEDPAPGGSGEGTSGALGNNAEE